MISCSNLNHDYSRICSSTEDSFGKARTRAGKEKEKGRRGRDKVSTVDLLIKICMQEMKVNISFLSFFHEQGLMQQ